MKARGLLTQAPPTNHTIDSKLSLSLPVLAPFVQFNPGMVETWLNPLIYGFMCTKMRVRERETTLWNTQALPSASVPIWTLDPHYHLFPLWTYTRLNWLTVWRRTRDWRVTWSNVSSGALPSQSIAVVGRMRPRREPCAKLVMKWRDLVERSLTAYYHHPERLPSGGLAHLLPPQTWNMRHVSCCVLPMEDTRATRATAAVALRSRWSINWACPLRSSRVGFRVLQPLSPFEDAG